MKQFIYLDTDIVNSIIAQSQKGVITQFTSEQSDGTTEQHDTDVKGGGSATIGGAIVKLAKVEANLLTSIGYTTGESSERISKEIISKTLHDAAFDIAMDSSIEKLIKEEPTGIGDYVKKTDIFEVIDFEHLQELFAQGGVIDYIKKHQKKEIDEKLNKIEEGLNREQGRKATKGSSPKVAEAHKMIDKQFDEIKEMVILIGKLIPYKRLLVSSDGYLVPLSDEYFRVDMKTLGFKIGGEITCIGMTTNVIGEDADPEDNNNIFATLQYSINELLRKLLPTKEENLWVIHPIALYYGK